MIIEGKTLKNLLLLVPLLIVLFLTADAQLPPNVVLTGQISDTYRENFNDYVIWKAKFVMEFTNRGNKPVILINPTLSYGTGHRSIVFYFRSPILDKEGKESPGFTGNSEAKAGESELLLELAKQLDENSPPENLLVILKPGESFPFSDNLVIRQSYFHNIPTGSSVRFNKWDGTMAEGSCFLHLDRLEKGCPLNFATSLTINYEFDFSVYREKPALLTQLNTRWRDYGQIPLTGESTISITSQPLSIYPMEWVTIVDPTIWLWDQPIEYDPNPILNFGH